MATHRRPRLGLALPTHPDTAPDAMGLARHLQQHGFEDVWIEEAARGDAYALAGAFSQAVPGMRIGTAVVPAQTRSLIVHAMAGASLSQLTGGRFVVGIGVSSENIVGDWAGLAFDRPVLRMREHVEVLRALLAGERVTYEGETLSVKGFKVKTGPFDPVPVFTAAMNPQMLRLTGRLADGVILNMVPDWALGQVLAEVRRGAVEAGRDPDEIEVVGKVGVMLTDDPEATRRVMIEYGFGTYVATAGYNRFYSWIGFEDMARAVREADEAGDKAGAAAAVTEDFIDAISILGDAELVRTRLRAYVEHGVDSLVVIPLVPIVDMQREVFETVAGCLDDLDVAGTGMARSHRGARD